MEANQINVADLRPAPVALASCPQLTAPKTTLDPVVKVRPLALGGEWSTWNITQGLTDRWGEFSDTYAGTTVLDELTKDPERFQRLVAQMWDECTFVVRKDGQYGILFEVEYGSIDSEARFEATLNEHRRNKALRPHAEVVARLMSSLEVLAPQYPGVEFAIPDEKEIPEDRPAAWAFVPDGLLNAEQREALGMALLRL